MHDAALRLYHCMPVFARRAAVCLRGLQLRSWRYGAETERLVEEAIQREHWTEEQWAAWRQERLAFVLHRAASDVPYYRRLWAAKRRRGDRSSLEAIENWPVLEKEMIRSHPAAFVASDCDTRRMFHEHTSGTSGKPLELWWSRDTVRGWYALFEARWRRWYGVTRHDRWAIFGGQLVTPVSRTRPPFCMWNPALNQLYCSSYHLAADHMPYYFDALRRHRITYLFGYTSALHALASEALRLKVRDLQFRVVITNAEPLYPHQRAVISEAFQCPVRETYGMAEIVTAASECNHSRLHFWPEVGVVETLAKGRSHSSGVAGELVCTGLFNADMPLIRYRTGDRGAVSDASTPCPCGRTLPILDSIEGRIDDVVYTADGRPVGRLDPIFKARLPLLEAQIIQERLDFFRVVYVPGPGCDASTEEDIRSRLRDRVGPVEVTFQPVDRIPRGANGKFRAVVSRVAVRPHAEAAGRAS